MKGSLCVLSGGTGTPKLLQGLIEVVDPEKISVIVNTGDDLMVGEAYVSPDVDAVLYTLAGIIDEGKWYGIKDDTFVTFNSREKRGFNDLLRLGDRDRKYCEERAQLISGGKTLSDVINLQRKRLGIVPRVFPMTDSKVTTLIKTPAGKKEFQEYWVRDGGKDEVLGVELEDISRAELSGGARDALESAESIIIGPSNPISSIGPIIRIGGVEELLKEKAVVAISPIRCGSPFSGPAGSMLIGLGYEISPVTIASLYSEFLDVLIIDRDDSSFAGKIEDKFGIRVDMANIYMNTHDDKFKLAQKALAACREGERHGR